MPLTTSSSDIIRVGYSLKMYGNPKETDFIHRPQTI